jgi:hypothetical protein
MSEWQPNNKRKLEPEEKRAPRAVPWRLDRPQTVSAVAIALVASLVFAWILWTFALRKEPGIAWRDDGIIVEVVKSDEVPRAEVTSVSSFEESFPWARPPVNVGVGSCRDPRFRIDGMPQRGLVYDDTEPPRITLVVEAPGCEDIRVEFRGQFQPGSPRYDQQCVGLVDGDGNCPLKYVDGQILSRAEPLLADEWRVTLRAASDIIPTPVRSSPPSVGAQGGSMDGFKLCELFIEVSDGIEGGSKSSQVVNVDCEEADDRRLL